MKVGFIQCTRIWGFYGIILYEYTTQMMVPSFGLLKCNCPAQWINSRADGHIARTKLYEMASDVRGYPQPPYKYVVFNKGAEGTPVLHG
jgi:hypothetical protein